MVTAKKVLIIEDEKAMAKALEIKLAHAGFEIKSTDNGKDGLKFFDNEDYSIVLLDLVLPGLSGFEILERLKQRKSRIPVIILSNLSLEEDEARARSLGAADFMVKSNTPIVKIVERVKEELGVLNRSAII